MNCKLNKFFTKSCAAALAVSSVFSGAKAAPTEGQYVKTEAKRDSGQISITRKGGVSALAGTTLATFLLTVAGCKALSSHSASSRQVNDEMSSQEVDSILLALNRTTGCSQSITKMDLYRQARATTDAELLKYIHSGNTVMAPDGEKYKYLTSYTENPASMQATSGGFDAKLYQCLHGQNDKSLTNIHSCFSIVPVVIYFTSNHNGVGQTKFVVATNFTSGYGSTIDQLDIFDKNGQTTPLVISHTSKGFDLSKVKEVFYTSTENSNAGLLTVGSWCQQVC